MNVVESGLPALTLLSPPQAMHNENMSLKVELQNLQAQISEQVRSETHLFS